VTLIGQRHAGRERPRPKGNVFRGTFPFETFVITGIGYPQFLRGKEKLETGLDRRVANAAHRHSKNVVQFGFNTGGNYAPDFSSRVGFQPACVSTRFRTGLD
jgi:hypothetical protein